MQDVDVLWHVLKPVTAQVVANAPRLRLIQKIGVGVNTIDSLHVPLTDETERMGVADA